MKAVVITRFGGPEVLAIRTVPEPRPARGQVLVRVRATAVNRADILQRLGRYPAPPGDPPDIPGLEFAGEVESVGPQVEALQPGERVMGLIGGGAYAERVAVAADLCLRVPPNLGWAEAAACPEAFATAFEALHRIGRAAPGEVVLVHAAASGIGTAAVQVARLAGARVIALSRSADKRQRLLTLGVHSAHDAADPELAARIHEAAGGRGVDLVLDLVGAAAWPLNLEVLGERGRLVLIGLLGGAQATGDLSLVLRKRLTVLGTVLRSRPLEERIDLTFDLRRRLLPLLEMGLLRPVVGRRFALAAAAEAHAHVQDNSSFGKTVLTVGEDT